jgi:hypothetical protein
VPTEALPIGANGLRFHNGALWVSNFNKGTPRRALPGRNHPPHLGGPHLQCPPVTSGLSIRRRESEAWPAPTFSRRRSDRVPARGPSPCR